MTKIDNLEDQDDVIKDGQMLRVPIFMMDSQQRMIAEGVEQLLKSGTLSDEQRAAFVELPSSRVLHAPGSLPMSDADRASREELYLRRDKRLTDAWKNAPPLDPAQAKIAITPPASTDIYERRDARLRDAWRSA